MRTLATILLLCSCVLARAQADETDLDRGRRLLAEGQAADALSAAQAALQAAPEDPAAHRLAARALVALARYDAALASAREALKRATPEARVELEQLVAGIERERRYQAALAAARAAEAEGLMAKATRGYSAAYRCKPTDTALGLRVARDWIRRDEPLEAARVLTLVGRHATDDPTRRDVTGLLGVLDPQLQPIHDRALAALVTLLRAPTLTPDALAQAQAHARTALDAATIRPRQQAAGYWLAAVHAAAGRREAAVAALAAAARAGALIKPTHAAVAFGGPHWARIRTDPAFVAFCADAFGRRLAAAVGALKTTAGRPWGGLAGTAAVEPNTPTAPRAIDGFTFLRWQTFACDNANEGRRQARVAVYRCTALHAALGDTLGQDDPAVDTEFVLLPPPRSSAQYKGAPFLIARCEVSQRLYDALRGPHAGYYRWTGATLPAHYMTWHEATLWSARVGLALPREAEWEYAARGGTRTAYCFGDDLSPVQANFGQSRDGPVAVGSLPANAFGLHEVHGNVWEWCRERFGGTTRRVIRGGSWYATAVDCAIGVRFRFEPTQRYDFLGLRLARTLPQK